MSAVRFKEDPSCYIHEPENYTVPGYKPERAKVGIGTFNFKCVLENDGGKSKEFHFKIVNLEDESPRSTFS